MALLVKNLQSFFCKYMLIVEESSMGLTSEEEDQEGRVWVTFSRNWK